MEGEQLQKNHYNKIVSLVDEHFDTKESMEYRVKFLYPYLFKDIELSDSKVLDAMCGSGQTTEYLLTKNAKVIGLDISDKAIENFKKRFPQCRAVCASIFDSGLKANSFDYIIVFGGLHHLHPYTDKGIDEIHRILKPGGIFCFVEPYKGTIINLPRRIWYKLDSLFEKNEGPVDFNKLQNKHSHQFDFIYEKYGGNIAFWLVLESSYFRIPLKFLQFYTPILFKLERFFQKFQGKFNSTYLIGQWQKKCDKEINL